MGPAEERELIDRARAGDGAAQEVIVRRLYPRLLASAIRLARRRDMAEDLAQETLIRALRAIDRFDGRSALFTWTYRILINLWMNALRREGHRCELAMSSFDDLHAGGGSRECEEAQPDRVAMGRESLRRLWEAIHALPDGFRTTLLMVVFEDMTYEEVGRALGCSEGTVAWRVFKAREMLRGRFEEELGPAGARRGSTEGA